MVVGVITLIFYGFTIYFGVGPLASSLSKKEPKTIGPTYYGVIKSKDFKLSSESVWTKGSASSLERFNYEDLLHHKNCVDQSRPGFYDVVCFVASSCDYWVPRGIELVSADYCENEKGCLITSKLAPNQALKDLKPGKVEYHVRLDQRKLIRGLPNETTNIRIRTRPYTTNSAWFKPILLQLEGNLLFFSSKNSSKPNFTQPVTRLAALLSQSNTIVGYYGISKQ